MDIEGIGRQTINSRIITRPRYLMPVGRTVQFHNIKKPKHKNRRIKLSANVIGRYQVTVATPKKTQYLGNAPGAAGRDLFREADHSRDDKAVQTFTIGNPNYAMKVRVTVIEID